MNTLASDGMQVNHYLFQLRPRPADLPSVDTVRKGLNVAGSELMAMRAASTAPDYTGPVLFESRAAAPLIAEVLGPSLSGARPPLAFQPVVDQLMSSLGARSEWSGKVGARVLPLAFLWWMIPSRKTTRVRRSSVVIPSMKKESPRRRSILVEQGKLKNLLMSRRPGPDFDKSNGHGRSAFLADPKPTMSNLFFTSTRNRFPRRPQKEISGCLPLREAEPIAW